MRHTPNPVSSEPESQGEGASLRDRAVVNGAGQAVSAVPASVPSAAHTPGPWELHKGLIYPAEFDVTFKPEGWAPMPDAECPEGFFVATVHDSTYGNQEADARLIAAAPDLVEAAEAAIALIDDMSRFVGQMSLRDYALFNEAPIKLRASLRKALGK